jgi:hypothetical protein
MSWEILSVDPAIDRVASNCQMTGNICDTDPFLFSAHEIKPAKTVQQHIKLDPSVSKQTARTLLFFAWTASTVSTTFLRKTTLVISAN